MIEADQGPDPTVDQGPGHNDDAMRIRNIGGKLFVCVLKRVRRVFVAIKESELVGLYIIIV